MTFTAPPNGPLIFRGAIAIHPPELRFGGISGLTMEGPRSVLAITDSGDWIRFELDLVGGRLVGVGAVRIAPILGAKGEPAPRGARDAEDLTRDPETGQVWVSFEGYHRIWEFAEPGGATSRTIRHPAWAQLNENNGIESLARAPDGGLWAIGEAASDGRFTAWVNQGPDWEMKTLPQRGPFAPTGAAFGPNGYLYVTERAFSFTAGFRFRLRRLKWGAEPEPRLEEELISLGAETAIDNIEGVTLWRENGRTFLLIASDDNFMPFERNVLALFEVTR